jgi:hypothetical protein
MCCATAIKRLDQAAHLDGLFNGLTQGLDGFRGGVRKMLQQQAEYSSLSQTVAEYSPAGEPGFL